MLGVLLIGVLPFVAVHVAQCADLRRHRQHDMGPASGLTNVAQQLSLSTGSDIGRVVCSKAVSYGARRSDVVADDFKVGFLVVGVIAMSVVSASRCGRRCSCRRIWGRDANGRVA